MRRGFACTPKIRQLSGTGNKHQDAHIPHRRPGNRPPQSASDLVDRAAPALLGGGLSRVDVSASVELTEQVAGAALDPVGQPSLAQKSVCLLDDLG